MNYILYKNCDPDVMCGVWDGANGDVIKVNLSGHCSICVCPLIKCAYSMLLHNCKTCYLYAVIINVYNSQSHLNHDAIFNKIVLK